MKWNQLENGETGESVSSCIPSLKGKILYVDNFIRKGWFQELIQVLF